MSRIADAMRRVPRLRGDDEREGFQDDSHPWDLGSRGMPDEPRVTLTAAFEPLHAVTEPRHAVTSIASRTSDWRKTASRPAVSSAKDTSAIDDSLRPHLTALVERVFAPVSGNPARCVAFSGLGAESGLVTAATGDMLASQTGSTVCLVDAHFSAPSLHGRFGLDQEPGFVDAIDEGLPLTERLHEVRHNLWVMPAGKVRHRPSFASDGVRVRLAQFFAEFDYVLVDIEPVSDMNDATGLAPLVDGVILVLAADATRRESARRATQVLQGIGAAILGAVLTNRRFPIPDALYRRL